MIETRVFSSGVQVHVRNLCSPLEVWETHNTWLVLKSQQLKLENAGEIKNKTSEICKERWKMVRNWRYHSCIFMKSLVSTGILAVPKCPSWTGMVSTVNATAPLERNQKDRKTTKKKNIWGKHGRTRVYNGLYPNVWGCYTHVAKFHCLIASSMTDQVIAFFFWLLQFSWKSCNFLLS